MLHRALVLTSLICCLFVGVSFALFARDQAAGASAVQQNQLASGTAVAPPSPSSTRHGQPRRLIDGAAGNLIAPFGSVVHSNNAWVERGVPTLLALLIYGVGVGFVARFSSGRP